MIRIFNTKMPAVLIALIMTLIFAIQGAYAIDLYRGEGVDYEKERRLVDGPIPPDLEENDRRGNGNSKEPTIIETTPGRLKTKPEKPVESAPEKPGVVGNNPEIEVRTN